MPPMETTEAETTQSSQTSAEAAPSPLPQPKRGRGRPTIAEMAAREGMTEAEWRSQKGLKPKTSQTKSKASETTVDGEVTRRKVPDEGPDRDKALKGFRMYARLGVKLVDSINAAVGMAALDADKKESGIEALSALLYQESVNLDARHLVAIWLLTTEVPKAIVLLQKKAEEKKSPLEKLKEQVAAEKTIEGEIVKTNGD